MLDFELDELLVFELDELLGFELAREELLDLVLDADIELTEELLGLLLANALD